MPDLRSQRPLNLLKWFGALSFLTVTVGAMATATVLSHFLAAELLQWDAVVTAEFIATVAETQSVYGRFSRKSGLAELLGKTATTEMLGVSDSVATRSAAEFYDHMRSLPGATAITVYALDRSIVWSHVSAEHVRHVDFDRDESLFVEQAFALSHAGPHIALGRRDYHPGNAETGTASRHYFENFIPLYGSGDRVVAVVEVDKEPARLIAAIERGQMLVWLSVTIAGMIVYLTLFWLARRATIVMADQHKRLVDAQTLGAIGELSLAVAHGIRNPLAAIRSSAELTLDAVPDGARKQVTDIIAQADRLSSWLRELLQFARPPDAGAGEVCALAVLHESIGNFSGQLDQAHIELDWIDPGVVMPPVTANRQLLLQAFNSVISNAVEAMPRGGRLTVRLELDRPQDAVKVTIADTGHGMSEEQLANATKPFRTSKSRGLGIGLALVKRTLERHGGQVSIESEVNVGTSVQLLIPIAR